MEMEIDRRVGLAELATLMNRTTEYIRLQRKAGRIPEPHRDHPNARPYYLLSEVQFIVAGKSPPPSTSTPDHRAAA